MALYVLSVFAYELSLISDPVIRKFVEDFLVNEVPKYFWEIPASSSGRYHPAFALGEGGLVRHVKAAVFFATQFFELYELSDKEKDIMIAALILHDCFKQGESDEGCGNTVHEHPILAARHIADFNGPKERFEIASCVATHMGKWTTSKYSDVVLDEPKTLLQKIVHRADYFGSRRGISLPELFPNN